MDKGGLVILGAGGHARVVAETAMLLGLSLLGYLAPRAVEPAHAPHPRYLGDDAAISAMLAKDCDFIPGTGFVDAPGAARRAGLLAQIPEDKLVRLIHPSAMVSPSAEIAAGVFIAAGAILGAGSRAAPGAILNSGTIVDHDSLIGANSHVAIGARVAGGVWIGKDCLVGAGATIRQGLHIGDGAVVAAGAVVLGDVAPGSTVAGVPARILVPGAKAPEALGHPTS